MYGCTAVQVYTYRFLLPVLSYCTFRVSSKFLFPCSMRAFYTATRTTSLCAHMSAFPTKKPTPTPYFAHFLKEILRMRAHSREGNIKGNCPAGGRGGVISIAPKAENRQKSYHNKESAVLDTSSLVLWRHTVGTVPRYIN